jgi:hypothetical protein
VTSTLPKAVQQAFERFITTEYTTIDSRGQPIAWPVTPYYRPGGPTIDITTGVGYPKKALDAQRNPRVGLLFSDPTGSGVESGIRVLVQGIADVDDNDLKANAKRYDEETERKVPASREWFPGPPLDRMFGWYFERIYVKVRPERVFVWPDGDLAKPPTVHDSHVEEVRSGHVEEPEKSQSAPSGGGVAWDGRIGELGSRHPEAVLAWVAPDGFPLSVRVPVELDDRARKVRIHTEPAELPLLEGRACLTAHRHAPDFSWNENFQVRGDLVRETDGWTLVPHRLVGGFEAPDSALARFRRNFVKAIRFYQARRRFLKQRRA